MLLLTGCQEENKFEKELREIKAKHATQSASIDRRIDSLSAANVVLKHIK